MKVISIGTDRKIFEEGSAVRERMIEYGNLFEKLEIIIFSKRNSQFPISNFQISENVFVYPTNSRNKFFYIFDAFLIIRKLIENSKLKIGNYVVSSQDPFETGLVGLILKFYYKLPLQIQLHTDFANKYFIFHSLLNFIRFPLGLFTLSFADSVRVVSVRIEKSIHSLSHNVSVLPIQTSPLASRSPLLVKERGESKAVSFLTVARLEKEKDLGTALRAFAEIKEDKEFVIVGDGSQRQPLQNLCEKLKITDKVKFVGWQNDLTKFWEDADIYVSTSLYEGYGMSMIEAAEHSLPLILTDAGIATEYFQDGLSAFVCPAKSKGEVMVIMQKLASNLDLRIAMGIQAKKAVSTKKISKEAYLSKFKNSLEEALAFNKSDHSLFKRNILLRYLVAGLTGASTQIGSLYIFTDFFGIWYLYSSLCSFALSIVISFLLQKLWTFNNKEVSGAGGQMMRYMAVALLGISINTFLMFVLVDILSIWYIMAQIIIGALIAVFNFLMYKFFIFNKQ